MASKRQAEDSVDSDNKRKPPLDSRPKCFFGLKCYRRNPEHFKGQLISKYPFGVFKLTKKPAKLF